MSGELVEEFSFFKNARYEHLFIAEGNYTISKEKFEYSFAYGIIGSFIHWVYGDSKVKLTLATAHSRLKIAAEKIP